MGNKYGSIHIKTKLPFSIPNMIVHILGDETVSHLFETLGYWEKLSTEQNGENEFVNKAVASLDFMTLSLARDFFAIKTQEWISIYSEAVTFQTVKDKAKAFADILPQSIIYASNFDDDLLVFGAYDQGKFVTSGLICEGENIFDLKSKSANMTSLRRVLGEESALPAKMPADLHEMEEILSGAMGVPLYVFEEFVCSDPEHYEKVEERYGVRVYEKLL